MAKKFKIIRTLGLEFLGQGWNECYLKLEGITWDELKEAQGHDNVDIRDSEAVNKEMDATLQFVVDHFIEGKVQDAEGKIVDLKKEDIGDLGPETVKRAMRFLAQG